MKHVAFVHPRPVAIVERERSRFACHKVVELAPVKPAAAIRTTHRPVPDDFATTARCESNRTLAKRYTASVTTIAAWRQATGIIGDRDLYAKPGMDRRPTPDDLATAHVGRTQTQLALYYRASSRTVSRWLREAGLTRTYTKAADRAPKPRGTGKSRALNGPVDTYQRDMTTAGQAADFLRHYGAVYRCDRLGRALPDGFYWRRGNAVLTDDEIIDRARFKGWAG